MRKVVMLAAALAACTALALAQDPAKVDPKHYKVEFENEQVRVLRISYGPGEKSVMHEHPANVAVFLTASSGMFTLPDGKTQKTKWNAGDVKWDAGGKHLPQNVGDKPFQLVLVELKGNPGVAQPPVALDPLRVDPKHYKLELENDQVRVLRITYGPHEKSVMHGHPANVAIFLTESHGKFTTPDGTTRTADWKTGDVMWDAGGQHLPENTGDRPFQLIVVELKGKPAGAK